MHVQRNFSCTTGISKELRYANASHVKRDGHNGAYIHIVQAKRIRSIRDSR